MFAAYARGLAVLLRHRLLVVATGFGALAVTLAVFWPIMRRDFYPEVDGGAFEMYARAPSGTRIERTVDKVALLEEFIKKTIPEHDLELIVSEIGVNADWSAAYTPNAGPMDAVIKVQLKEHRTKSAKTMCIWFAPAWPKTRGSGTWTSALMPAAWSAVP